MAPGKPAKATWTDGVARKKQAGVADMTLLSKITNDEISENLKKRFLNSEIYASLYSSHLYILTYIGNVLISVNPFRDLGIYTQELINTYQGKNRLELPPHVFAIAESMFKNMVAYKENQCVIISGESGAGKTEAAKRILEYISAVSGESSSSIQKVKEMVLATNPLLESFGNAKTLRNNNSSRHGKYLEVQFNLAGEPLGAKITNYLLEKSRVVSQIKNERNFHILYQITKAAPQSYRDMFGISKPEEYRYISAAGCISVSNIDDVKDYADVISAMNIIGLSQDEQTNLHRMLAAILWLGNVDFVENDNSESSVSSPQVIEFLAYLFETNADFLTTVLETRTIETQRGGRRGSVYKVPLNKTQAIAARDALAMAIYNRMFDWIVDRINLSLEARGNIANDIGVLDIYGFEIFDNNSFEQMCINYVNEKLQQIFIELTLKTEQEEYVREQIQWTPIEYFNNKVVCDLIEMKRPPGVFAAMNDAVATAHADSTAADNSLKQRLSSVRSEYFDLRDSTFTIKHYAGNVTYTISGMTDKNKDQLFRDHLELCETSSNKFLNTLFVRTDSDDSKRRPPTASDRIKSSANDLVVKLSNAQPSYIRTIKPNENKSATEFDQRRVLHQVKYLGLCENIRIRRAGFAYRQTFDKFVERFYLLSSSTSYAGEYTWRGDTKSACAQIFRDTNIDRSEWQLGVTKAFIRHPETLWALESMRERYWYNMAVRIQRAWRRYMEHKHECARKIQNAYRRNKNNLKYIQMRDYGNRILDGRKERRRYSLVSYRTFFGDYLNVNSPKSEEGSITRSTIRLQPSDKAVFSSHIDFLAARQLRSAKPAPRILVVTSQYMYIISQIVERGLYKQTLDHTAALVSISAIGMSPYQDGWVIFNIERQPSFVLRCDFKTELVTQISMVTNGRIGITVAPQLDYFNKKMKASKLAFVKNEASNFEVFKNKQVMVSSGMPPNSPSNPPARRMANKPTLSSTVAAATAASKSQPSRPNKASASQAVPKPRPQQQQQQQYQQPQAQQRPISTYKTQPQQTYPTPASQATNGYTPPSVAPNKNSVTNNYNQNSHPLEQQQQQYSNSISNSISNNRNDNRANIANTLNQNFTASAATNKNKSPDNNGDSGAQNIYARPTATNNKPTLSDGYKSTKKNEDPQNIYKRPTASTNNYGNSGRAPSKPSGPPPPPPPQVPSNPIYKSLYDYPPQNPGEMALVSNRKYEVMKKDPNGWWFASNDSGETGWIPSNYLDQNPEPLIATTSPPSQNSAATPDARQFNQQQQQANSTGYRNQQSSTANARISLNAPARDNSMAQLAAALAEWPSPSKNNSSSSNYNNNSLNYPNNKPSAYARPTAASNKLAQNNNRRQIHDDSDDEEAWN